MKQVGYRDKTPMVDKLAGQLEDAQERITDLGRKLAAAREALPLLGKKLHCLYLAVESQIADDIFASYKELCAALTEAGTRQCKWTYSEGEEYYDTECGKAFQLSNEHSLASNGFRFCCYCGAALTEMEEER